MNSSKTVRPRDSMSDLLAHKGLVGGSPRANLLDERAELCRAEQRPMKLLYGETFDEKGNTLDSVKYYLFTSLLATAIENNYQIAVEPTILIADLGVFRNYPDKLDEMKVYAQERVNFANSVKETYNCNFEVKFLSDIAETVEFKTKLEKASEVSKADSTLMQMIIETVPPDRRAESAKNGYIYSLEEIATILGIDIKIGPPREKLYDTTANAMLPHFGFQPLLPVYLTTSYPLGMDYSSYVNLPMAKYGLTPYKAGSGGMTDNRIVIGVTPNPEIERLLSETEIQPAKSKPNPVLDVLTTADMARQHMQRTVDIGLAANIYKKYYDRKVDPSELKSRTYTELLKYVLNVIPEARATEGVQTQQHAVDKVIDPWSNIILTKQDRARDGFVISEIGPEIRQYFTDSTSIFSRDIAIGHTDFNVIAHRMNNGESFSIISGFSSSGEFHYGHKVIIDAYNFFRQSASAGYFVVCDLDAYVSRSDKTIPDMATARRYAIDNITDVLAMGVKREDIRVQSKQESRYFMFTLELSKIIPSELMEKVLGHTDAGKYSAVYLQIADILYPQILKGPDFSLVPVGIDQKPILRLAREAVARSKKTYGFMQPSVLYMAHMPSLINYNEKMSKSTPGSALLLNSTSVDFERVLSNAVTGGMDTREEQVKFGGNPDICPIFEMHRFNQPDNNFVTVTYEACKSGTMLCSADKKALLESMRSDLDEHVRKRVEYSQIAIEIMEGARWDST